MEAFFLYIIKSSFCLILLYLFFKALLSRETFFRFNRFVLLGGIIISAILPLIILQISEETIIQLPVRQVENFITPENTLENDESSISETLLTDHYTTEENTENLISSSEKANFPLSKTQILFSIYLIGLSVSLAGLIISVSKMIQLIRAGRKISENKHTIVLVDKKICPFSFGKYVVLSETDYTQNPTEIITHELIHAKKRHSLDLIFMEFFVLLHWFNPVIWLLKRELQDIHEYEADCGVINQGIDATKYQLLLVKKAVGASSYTIANSFNHSKIKNRITMMLRQKSTQWARLKLVLFVPVALVVLQAFARPEIAGIEETLLSSEVTTISQETKKWSKEYFDEKTDEFLKQPNAVQSAKKWYEYRIYLGPENANYYATMNYPLKSKSPNSVIVINHKEDPKFDKSLIDHLLKNDKQGVGKGTLFPQILYLDIVPGTDEKRISDFLNKIGETNEKILKNWEAASANPKIKITSATTLKNSAILLVINEKIRPFLLEKYGESAPQLLAKNAAETWDMAMSLNQENKSSAVKLKETVKMTEIVVLPDTTSAILKISGTIANEPIKIMDANGSLKGTFEAQEGTTTIDLTGYEKGTYKLEYKGKTHKIIRKVVLK